MKRFNYKKFKKQQNYAAVLEAELKKNPIEKPGLYSLEILHDDWCLKLKGGECNCNPEIGERKGA